MKFLKNILIAGLLAIAFNASAQFDYFAEPRTVVMTSPMVISTTTTNNAIDTHGWEGIGKIDFLCTTNSQTNGVTVQVYTSADLTNWNALSNYAVASYTSIVYTNTYSGSVAVLATNNYLLPGTNTTPTASTSGFATPYIAPAAFTNSGSQTLTNSLEIGFVIGDAQRYLRNVWTLTTQTNGVGAFFTGRKQQQ